MHELSIAQSIVEVVEARAAEYNAVRVKGVRLKIGEASGVVTDSLTFCFEMLASLEPTLAGAQLLIDIVPHRAHCHHCARSSATQTSSATAHPSKNGSDKIFSEPNSRYSE